jgi:hypothetical protein
MPTASATTLAAAPVKIVLNNFDLTMYLQFLPGSGAGRFRVGRLYKPVMRSSTQSLRAKSTLLQPTKRIA